MRFPHHFVAFVAFALVIFSSLAAPAPATREPSELDRIRKQLEVFAKDIHKQPKTRKLVYMVLLLQVREYVKVVEFYKGLDKEGQDDLFMRMIYAQTLTASKEYLAAASVLDKIARKFPNDRLLAQVTYLRGLDWQNRGCNLGKGYFIESIERFDATYAPAYYMLGRIADKHTEAIRYYTQALALEQPSSDLARKARKDLLHELERHSEAAPK